MKTIYSVLFSIFLLLTGHTLTAQLPQLIGMTKNGGANDFGVIYKSNLDGTGFTPVYSFGAGDTTHGKLVQAANKLLYGAQGEEFGSGNLFSYDPVKNIYKLVFNFGGNPEAGQSPNGLLLADDGLLYGTTTDFFGSYYGELFSLNPATNTFTVLFSFSDQTADGAHPTCTMVQGSDEKLYGTTVKGGTNNTGVIFNYDIFSKVYTKLANFPTGIVNPYGSLVQAINGSFYGFAKATNGYNVVYVFNPATKAISLIHNFGQAPITSENALVKDNIKSYVLYGASVNAQRGELFTITTTTNTYNQGHVFGASDGSKPTGGLLNINNNLYGVTYEGGVSNLGVIFEQPSIGSFKTLYSFTGGTGGMNPVSGLIKISCTEAPAKPGTITGPATATCKATKKYTIKPVSGATSYKWTVPAGATITGTSTDTVISVKWGTTGGNVSVQASNDCGISAKKSLAVTITCSSKELITDNAVAATASSVTPNPTTGNVVVHFTGSIASKYIIRVVDIAGKILLTQEINTVVGSNIKQLDLSKLAKGIYYIQLSGEADKQIFKVVLE